MKYDLTIDAEPDFADKFKITRANGANYVVRGFENLARAMRKEARTAVRLGAQQFVVRDEQGRVLYYKHATNTFIYK